MRKAQFSIKSRIKSFYYAAKGIAALFSREHNAKIHLAAAIAVVLMGFFFHISYYEWMAVVIVIGMVFLAELFNTAIESLGDVVDPNRNFEIGRVKDLAAGAVLVSAIVALVIGGIVFIPHIVALLE